MAEGDLFRCRVSTRINIKLDLILIMGLII